MVQKYKVNRKSPNLFTKNAGKSPNLFTKNVGKSPNLCCICDNRPLHFCHEPLDDPSEKTQKEDIRFMELDYVRPPSTITMRI